MYNVDSKMKQTKRNRFIKTENKLAIATGQEDEGLEIEVNGTGEDFQLLNKHIIEK